MLHLMDFNVISMIISTKPKEHQITLKDNPSGTQVLLLNHIKDGYQLTCGKRYTINFWDGAGINIHDDKGNPVTLSRQRFIKIPVN